MKVIYRNGEIPNLMISERLVLKGKYVDDKFECKDVQTKCPSKYKEEMKPTDSSVLHTLTSQRTQMSHKLMMSRF